MTNKRIKFHDLTDGTQFLIILGICGFVFGIAIISFSHELNSYKDLQSQIDSLPHKYCHNETSFTKNWTVETGNSDSNVISISLLGIQSYEVVNCFKTNETNWFCGIGYRQKEVCEIR